MADSVRDAMDSAKARVSAANSTEGVASTLDEKVSAAMSAGKQEAATSKEGASALESALKGAPSPVKSAP